MSDRKKYEAWLMNEHGLAAEWDEGRNCYAEFRAHIAWKAWQAASADHEMLVEALKDAEDALLNADSTGRDIEAENISTLLAQLQADKGGE